MILLKSKYFYSLLILELQSRQIALQICFCLQITYLDIFDTDKAKVAELKDQYQAGGLGDVKIKRYLNEVLEGVLSPIRERRAQYEQNMDYVYQVLREGSEKANIIANQTLEEVQDAMGINYFKQSAETIGNCSSNSLDY